ncbi:hypothetical protein [Phyllobacterium sp. SB3]|uniref:hypothetical protein n=1 Tax=Phyllobacterium sp. SB3 TaxID=3156073 RepID=UPI0032AF6901
MKHRFYLLLPLVFIAGCNGSDSKSDTAGSTFETEIKTLKADNENLTKRVEILTQANADEQRKLAEQIKTLTSAVKQNEIRNVKLEQELDEAKQSLALATSDDPLLEKTIADLEAELFKTGSEKSELQKELTASLKVISDPATGLAALKKQIEDNTALIATLRDDKAVLAEQVKDLKKIDVEKTARVGELERQITLIGDEITAAGSANAADLIAKKTALEIERNELKTDKERLETRLAETTKKLEDPATGIEALQAQIVDNGKVISDLQNDKEKLAVQVAELKTALDDNQADRNALRKKLEDLTIELAKPGEDNPDLLKQVKDIKATLAGLEVSKANLDSLLAESAIALEKAKADSLADKAALAKTIAENKATIDQLMADKGTRDAEIAALKAEAVSLREDLCK